MVLGWLSDIHLDFLSPLQRREVLARLATAGVDLWLISGDIGQAPTVAQDLEEIASAVKAPVAFVLGNHDYYRGRIQNVRRDIRRLVARRDDLVWLTEHPVPLVREGVAIVGDDGWGDARLGDPRGSRVELNDFHLIAELAGLDREERIRRVRLLGEESADRLRPRLDAAARSCPTVVVVTHVPPFAAAAWHEGKTCDPQWLPWFSCRAVGEVLVAAATAHLQTRFLVLCGHTHGQGRCEVAANVEVLTAGASYGRPGIAATLEVRDGVWIRIEPDLEP